MSPNPGEEHLVFWLEHLAEPFFVYVIQGEPETPIKVGVARNPQHRLRGLQTGNPQRLRLLHVVPGSYELETSFHDRLAESKVLGEWYGEPGIDEFLTWVADYAEEAVKNFKRTGRLPAPPAPKPPKRKGLKTHDYLGHRWRTSDGKANPITVRFVEPAPKMPREEAEKIREAVRDFPMVYRDRLPKWAKKPITPSEGFGN